MPFFAFFRVEFLLLAYFLTPPLPRVCFNVFPAPLSFLPPALLTRQRKYYSGDAPLHERTRQVSIALTVFLRRAQFFFLTIPAVPPNWTSRPTLVLTPSNLTSQVSASLSSNLSEYCSRNVIFFTAFYPFPPSPTDAPWVFK